MNATARILNALIILSEACVLIGRDLEAGRCDAGEAGTRLGIEQEVAFERVRRATADPDSVAERQAREKGP